MKKLFLSTLLAVLTTAAFAVPAKRGVWKTVKLVDGSEIKVELRGDEYGSYWQAADGRCFVAKTGTELYQKADMVQIQKMAMDARLANPLPIVKGGSSATKGQRVNIGGEHPDFIGSKKCLIILAEFTDKKFQPGHDAAYYSRIANEVGFTSAEGHVGSIHDYFHAQSEGQFDLTFDVVGPVQLAHDMEYYGGHSQWGGNDKNAAAMIRECVNAAATELGSFVDYDWFGDGYVDQVFVIYAGRGEANGGGENTIWPHRSEISRILKGGKYVKVYACSNEMQSDNLIDGIGAFCHEFSHCLGLADLYDTQYGQYNNGKEYYGMGHWDIMDGGCYLGNSFQPCSYSGFERNYCGWKEPIYLTEDTEVTGLKGISEGGDYYIIKNDGLENEYYIIENRQQTGWDSSLYGSGLLISHIDYDQNVWQYNVPNSNYPGINDHPRYTLFLADNNEKMQYASDIAGDLYPYKTNNQLTNYTVPASTLYHNNIDGAKFMSKPITNITRTAGGTMSFSFKNEIGVTEDDPMPEGCIFRETFKHSYGTGGNDGVWSGTGVAAGEFIADNDDWSSAQKFGANKCARFGTNTQRGNATTPEIDLGELSDYEVSFMAAPWTGEASTITLSVVSGTGELAKTSFPVTAGQWTECKTTLSGTGVVKIKFASNKARFFLDEVFVTKLDEPAPKKGDVNGDGVINITDLNLIIDAMSEESVSGATDINGDGKVNITDLNLVIDIMSESKK